MWEKKPSAKEIAKQILGKEVTPLGTTHQPDHKHEWELVSKTSAPSRKDIPQAQMDQDTLNKLLFGVTTYLWECILCKDLRKEVVLGSDVSQLDELLDKADRFGPQYIQGTNGSTFVIGKYSPPPTVPMR